MYMKHRFWKAKITVCLSSHIKYFHNLWKSNFFVTTLLVTDPMYVKIHPLFMLKIKMLKVSKNQSQYLSFIKKIFCDLSKRKHVTDEK